MELLGRLRRAVKKVTFLINLKNYLNLTKSTLRLASLIRARAPAAIAGPRWGRRAISFSDSPGLRACVEGYEADHERSDEENCKEETGASRSEVSSGASSPCTLRRTTSYPLEEDVDKKAEMFIENFYRHLVFEKQVSLNLRYICDDSSFTDTTVSPLSSAGSQLVSPT